MGIEKSGSAGAADRPAPRLPAPLLARARRARRVVEVGAGARFDVALALARASPQAEWWVTDVDPRVLAAPAPLRAALLDAHAPTGDWSGTDLVYAMRVPEELQGAVLAFARSLGADAALRPLKDEWADAGPRRALVWPDGWRYFPIE